MNKLAQQRQGLHPIFATREFAGCRFNLCQPQKAREMHQSTPSVTAAQAAPGAPRRREDVHRLLRPHRAHRLSPDRRDAACPDLCRRVGGVQYAEAIWTQSLPDWVASREPSASSAVSPDCKSWTTCWRASLVPTAIRPGSMPSMPRWQRTIRWRYYLPGLVNRRTRLRHYTVSCADD